MPTAEERNYKVFDSEMQTALRRAGFHASRSGHPNVAVAHVVFALLWNERVRRLLLGCHADLDLLGRELRTHLSTLPCESGVTRPGATTALTRAQNASVQLAAQSGRRLVEATDFLVCAVGDSGPCTEILEQHGIYAAEIRRLVGKDAVAAPESSPGPMTSYAPELAAAFENAVSLAEDRWRTPRIEDLVLALLDAPSVRRAVEASGCDVDGARGEFEHDLGVPDLGPGSAQLDDVLESYLLLAEDHARLSWRDFMLGIDVFSAILQLENASVVARLSHYGFTWEGIAVATYRAAQEREAQEPKRDARAGRKGTIRGVLGALHFLVGEGGAMAVAVAIVVAGLFGEQSLLLLPLYVVVAILAAVVVGVSLSIPEKLRGGRDFYEFAYKFRAADIDVYTLPAYFRTSIATSAGETAVAHEFPPDLRARWANEIRLLFVRDGGVRSQLATYFSPGGAWVYLGFSSPERMTPLNHFMTLHEIGHCSALNNGASRFTSSSMIPVAILILFTGPLLWVHGATGLLVLQSIALYFIFLIVESFKALNTYIEEVTADDFAFEHIAPGVLARLPAEKLAERLCRSTKLSKRQESARIKRFVESYRWLCNDGERPGANRWELPYGLAIASCSAVSLASGIVTGLYLPPLSAGSLVVVGFVLAAIALMVVTVHLLGTMIGHTAEIGLRLREPDPLAIHYSEVLDRIIFGNIPCWIVAPQFPIPVDGLFFDDPDAFEIVSRGDCLAVLHAGQQQHDVARALVSPTYLSLAFVTTSGQRLGLPVPLRSYHLRWLRKRSELVIAHEDEQREVQTSVPVELSDTW